MDMSGEANFKLRITNYGLEFEIRNLKFVIV